MKEPKKKPKVKLTGTSGNAMSIMAKVTKALQKAGADKEYTDKYMQEAMSGDYNNVIQTSMKYVDVS